MRCWKPHECRNRSIRSDCSGRFRMISCANYSRAKVPNSVFPGTNCPAMTLLPAVYHNLWDFWTRVLATWFATGHYHAETTAGMLMVVGETMSEP